MKTTEEIEKKLIVKGLDLDAATQSDNIEQINYEQGWYDALGWVAEK